MDFQFNHLESLHWLWAVLAAGVFMALGLALRRRDLARFADDALLGRLLAGIRPGRRFLRAALRIAALVMLVGALLDPRFGTEYEQVEQRGVDVVVVLDVSKSMLAEDAKPNRLERARQYIGDLVQALGGDRVALVAFAGVPELKCPLTVDHGAFRLSLAAAEPKSAPRGGSLLGDAIRLAGQVFVDRVPDHKAIVVFSDGEDQGSEAVEAAKKLREELSVPIYTVGIGDTVDGAQIPIETPGGRQYLTWEGQPVWSKMNADLLREVALASGGAFIPVGTGTVDMGRLYAERIEPIAGRQFEPVTLKRRTPRYQWFAGLSLLLLLGESLVGDGKRKRRSDEATERRRGGLLATAMTAAVCMVVAPMVLGAESDAGTLRDAGRALAEKRYDDALKLYEQARAIDSQAAEIPYNMGVAAYRKGDLDQAAQLFDQARMLATDPALRAHSAYNLGTTAYRKSISQPEGAPEAQAAMQQAREELSQAIERFRETIDADPTDMDARVNGELAWRWLEQLKEMKKQQQQQQQGQQQQDQQQQDQQQQQQQQQGEQQQGEEQQQQQQQTEGDQGQSQEGEEQQEEKQQAAQEQPEPKEAAGDSAERRPMSREEAERLLQGVRDRQRQRQQELARQRNARKPPVDKDW